MCVKVKSTLHPDMEETALTVTIKKITSEVKKELTNLAGKDKIRHKQDPLVHKVEETKSSEDHATKGQNEVEKRM